MKYKINFEEPIDNPNAPIISGQYVWDLFHDLETKHFGKLYHFVGNFIRQDDIVFYQIILGAKIPIEELKKLLKKSPIKFVIEPFEGERITEKTTIQAQAS